MLHESHPLSLSLGWIENCDEKKGWMKSVGWLSNSTDSDFFLSLSSPLHSSRPSGCLIKKKQIIQAYPVPGPFHRHHQSPCKHFAFAYGPVLSSALASLHSLAKCKIQFFHLIPPLSFSLRELNFPTKNPSRRWAWASINAFALYSRKCLKIHNKISQK